MTDWVAVTGGCGYIGSHIAAQLKKIVGCKVLIIDREASDQPHTHWTADEIVDADIASPIAYGTLSRIRPMAVIHCAGTSLVSPSVSYPGNYYHNNVVKTIGLLDFMRNNNLNNFIFSSSASVYGESWAAICSEQSAKSPINPYGRTKAMIEDILEDYSNAYGINSVRFRYFNAAGADPSGKLGQAHGATHLLARIMESIIEKKTLTVYGDKYPTADGTCVRDYAHVADIARAHVLAIDYLKHNSGSHVFNLGSGNGTTVLEMLEATKRVTGQDVSYSIGENRIGDPAILVADINKAKKVLGWEPQYSVDDMVKHAWEWYKSNAYDQSGHSQNI